jgi:hypothetical protein
MFCSSTFALNPELLQPQNQHMDLSIGWSINSYYVHLTKILQAICKVGRTQKKAHVFAHISVAAYQKLWESRKEFFPSDQ